MRRQRKPKLQPPLGYTHISADGKCWRWAKKRNNRWRMIRRAYHTIGMKPQTDYTFTDYFHYIFRPDIGHYFGGAGAGLFCLSPLYAPVHSSYSQIGARRSMEASIAYHELTR